MWAIDQNAVPPVQHARRSRSAQPSTTHNTNRRARGRKSANHDDIPTVNQIPHQWPSFPAMPYHWHPYSMPSSSGVVMPSLSTIPQPIPPVPLSPHMWVAISEIVQQMTHQVQPNNQIQGQQVLH